MDFLQQVVIVIRREFNHCKLAVSMKNAVISVWVLFVVLFASWYVPVSFVNVFTCDDFWHGTNVIENGFLQTQLSFYCSWEGSFTHTFLATIPHVFKYSHVPFVVNMVTLTFLVISACCFIKVYFVGTWCRSLLYSILTSVFFLVVTGCGAEIRFWVCSSLPYVFGVSTMMLFMACYHIVKLSSWGCLCVLWFLQILIVGNKVSYIICLFVCMIVHDVVFKTFSLKKVMMLYFSAALFSLINVVAPGNYARLNENLENACTLPFLRVVGIRFMHMIPIVLWSLAFPMFVFKRNLPRRRTIIAIVLGVIIFFLMESICLYFCFRDPGPLRTYILSEILFIVLGVVVRDAVLYKIRFDMSDIGFYAILCGIVLCFAQLSLIRQVPPTISYAKKATERALLVKAQSSSRVIRIPELPPSYLLLSYFANDVLWLKNVYLSYFHMRDCDIELVELSKGRQM